MEKLVAYERLARGGGPAYPVLFSLHSPDREAHLHAVLGDVSSASPIATTVRPIGPHAATDSPAGVVWAVAGHNLQARRRLADLPSDHGPDHPRNPNWHAGRLHLDETAM